MEASQSSDLRAVWIVQSRKIFSRLEFWLILIGYDRRRRSFDSWIYLVYVFIFFSIWIFVVLTFLAGVTGQMLSALPFGSPFNSAIVVGGAAFTAIYLIELYSASRRSPFLFSEADSTLLCMTPVDRRFVALSWFLNDWVVRGLLYGAGAIVLGYAYLEAQFPGELGAADLPAYIIAGMRMWSVFLPLHLAAQSSAWAIGAWRLHGRRDRPVLIWIAPLLAILLVAAWILSSPSGEDIFPTWVWSIALPLRSGLGAAPLAAGVGLGLLCAVAGIALLWIASGEMSLARAAQETRGHEVLQTALLTVNNELVRELRLRRRLGAERRPIRLPARQGSAALIWKNAVRGMRSFTLDQALPWLVILGLSLAIFLAPDLGTMAWLVLVWIFFVGGRAVQSLRRDLKIWWLLRQFPYSSEQLVLLNLGLPLLGIALTSLVVLIFAVWIGVSVPPVIAWMFFPGAVGVAFAAAVDILRQAHTSLLLSGSVPDRSLLSVLLGALVLGISGFVAWLMLTALSTPLWLGILVMLAVCAGFDYGLYRWAGYLLRNVR